MENIFISVIMPAYNAEKYIRESIESLQKQTFRDWELIVVDDGSTDGTASIVRAMQAADTRIQYIFQTNKRLGAARNAGLRKARGEWIAYLDSDDLWMDNKLESQVDLVTRQPDLDIVFTDGYILKEETQELVPYPTIQGSFDGATMYRLLFEANYIPVLSVLMKRDWIAKAGFQDESPSIFGCEDWDMWLRIARQGGKFYGIGEKLFKYRVHEGGMSRKLAVMKLAESTALYKNIDTQLLAPGTIRKRFSELITPLIPALLMIDRREDALAQLQILRTLTPDIRLTVLSRYLRTSKRIRYRIVKWLSGQ